MKKEKETKKLEYALNRKQLMQLSKIAEAFPNAEWFTIEESYSSGIGATVTVKLKIFEDDEKDFDTTIDITDVTTW